MGPSSSISDGAHPADVALTLSRRLVSVVRVKNMLHIEAGLEMIALAMAISSEVPNVIKCYKRKLISALLFVEQRRIPRIGLRR
jgi:hypothetical protein